MKYPENVVVVRDLQKTFKIPLEASTGIKQKLINVLKGRKGYREFSPLNGVSFDIKQGEFFGIVGRNGSGKSTLLKTIAGIYTPTKGSVRVDGSLVPFIELGVGFNPELTGQENVFLNGALLGFSHSEMEAMYDDIVDFAELHDFMQERLKNYSSGMQVRLAFSIAIKARGDILLLDEVLAVGDAAFQQKCFDYFASLKRDKKTVILVSHSMGAIERFCTRALLLEKGKVVKIGDSKEVATLYENLFLDDMNATTSRHEGQKIENAFFAIDTAIYQGGKPSKGVEAFKDFSIVLGLESKSIVPRVNIGFNIRNAEGVVVYSQDMRKLYKELALKKGETITVEFSIENTYTNGRYTVDAIIVNEGSIGDKVLLSEANVCDFEIFGVRDHVHSIVHPNTKVSVQTRKK